MSSERREPGTERVIESRLEYAGKIASFRVDTVELPGGRMAKREIVEHEPVVSIVPIHANGDVVLVRQYRLATGGVMLEVPAGGVDEGESFEEAAQRELSEEVGLRAGTLLPLADFYPSPGFLTERVIAYLATDLSGAPGEPDEDEDIVVVRMPLAEAIAMVERGQFHDAKSIVSILLAERCLKS